MMRNGFHGRVKAVCGQEYPQSAYDFRAYGVEYNGSDRAGAPLGAVMQDDTVGRTDRESDSHSLRRAGNICEGRTDVESKSAPWSLHCADDLQLDRSLDGGNAALL
jgi:hypothetical protein